MADLDAFESRFSAPYLALCARCGDADARARVAAVMLMTLRGTPFIYYGEEIGMPDAPIASARKLDPVGRDGCRSPMQWSDALHGGFSTARAPPGFRAATSTRSTSRAR